MTVNTWWQYVSDVTERATLESVARKVDVSQATVSRWQASTPKPENVADFARAYGRPVLEAFVAAGFLTADEAKQRPMERHPITDYSDDELVAEVRRRLAERGGSNAEATPPEKSFSGGRPPGRVVRGGLHGNSPAPDRTGSGRSADR